jgi:RNA polymerase sigma-70 factor (ECF subfamily)
MLAATKLKVAAMVPADVEALFEAHHARVFRTALRVTGSAMDAEDVLQTLFLKLIRRENRIPSGDAAGSYLHRAAVNLALDVLRRRGRQVDLDSVSIDWRDPSPRPDEEVGARELAAWLRSAVSRLNPRAAEIFLLHHVEGLSNREISQLLDASWGVVAVTLHRTHRRLRQQIQADLGRNV